MKTKKLILVAVGLAALAAGCGRNPNGSYTGTETSTVSGMAVSPSPVTVTVNENGNVATVSFSGGVNGSISGQWNGTSITFNQGNLTKSITGTAALGGYNNGYGTGTGSTATCTVSGGTGTITFSNPKTFTANLTCNQTAAGAYNPTGVISTFMVSGINITATGTN